MIVRDEEAFLPACLESIRPVVDEIVLVDTGSTDRSREIAREFGARLIDFPWIDDFSAARNIAIDHARCDWMLYIDADERLRPIDKADLGLGFSDRTMIAATVAFRPRLGFTAYREYRLIRRDPRIRFRGAMHETFLPDVHRLVRSGDGCIGHSAMAIDHLGYEGDQSHKLDRNLRLLRKEIPANPDRAYLRWHLGCVLRDLGRMDEAQASWREGLRLGHVTASRDAVLCAIELAKEALLAGHDPTEMIAEGLILHPGNWMLLWLRGKACLQSGHVIQARPIFESLAAVDPLTLVDEVAYDCRLFGASALQELAEDAFLREDYPDAADLFSRALEKKPDSTELRAKHALASARAQKAIHPLPG
jgi:tetratricopeptide (TPR) repeat protein